MNTLERRVARRFSLPVRLLVMLAVVAALIVGSTWTRRLPPGRTLTIWVNILYFVVLGVADEVVLGPVLDRWPLGRAAALIGETLALGWFFAPGRLTPASKTLFFAHIAPFFVAVFGGAFCALVVRRWRSRQA